MTKIPREKEDKETETKFKTIQHYFLLVYLVGIVLYMAVTFLYFIGLLPAVAERFETNIPFYIGIPFVAITSFAIVSIFWRLHPPKQDNSGQQNYEFSVFNLKFSGPGGPIILWMFCFLSGVLAVVLVSKPF